jgi:DNA-binding transcriptional MocR family regulator
MINPNSVQKRQKLITQTTQAWCAPGVTDFGVGQPQDALLPLELLHKAADKALSQGDLHPLQYGCEYGDGYLRLALADFLSDAYGIAVDPEPIFITNGNSQALDMVCTIFAKPGDTVFVEEPSYFLALDIFRNHHLKVVGIPLDQDGLIIEALEEALKIHRPAFLYTIPAFQNPTGFTLAVERRQRLVELSQQHNFLIVADEVYQLLNYTMTPPKPMAAYVESGTVLSLGTFSKILAPGLRLGWIQAAQPLIQRLSSAGYVISGGGLNPFASAMVRTVLEEGWQHEYLQELRQIYQARIEVMDAGLRQHFPKEVQYIKPGGGYFFWLRFPEQVDTNRFLAPAEAKQVGFRPGSKFSASGALRNYMRLSFAFFGAETLKQGIETLGTVVTL